MAPGQPIAFSNGNRVETNYILTVVGNLLTLQRSFQKNWNVADTAQTLVSFPTAIDIDGNGALITGGTIPGAGVRFLEFNYAQECHVRGFIADASGGGLPNDLLFSFDVGGYANTFSEMTIRGSGVSLVGLALESNASSRIDHCAVDCGGAGYGIIFYDCSDCAGDGLVTSNGTGAGLYLTADGNVIGCNDCRLDNSSAIAFTVTGCAVDLGSTDCQLSNCAFNANGIGLTLGDGANVVARCAVTNRRCQNNTTTGVFIDSNTPNWLLDQVNVSGNGVSAATGTGPCRLRRHRARSRGHGRERPSRDRRQSGCAFHRMLVHGCADPRSKLGTVRRRRKRYRVRDCSFTVAGGAAGSNVVHLSTACILHISGTVLACNGGIGVFADVNTVTRIEEGNDWSGAPTQTGGAGYVLARNHGLWRSGRGASGRVHRSSSPG